MRRGLPLDRFGFLYLCRLFCQGGRLLGYLWRPCILSFGCTLLGGGAYRSRGFLFEDTFAVLPNPKGVPIRSEFNSVILSHSEKVFIELQCAVHITRGI